MITSRYFDIKWGVAEYVEDLMSSLKQDSVLTMTIKPGKYEGYYVTSVIEESLEDIEVQNSSKQPMNT
jgi:hypothetical protein